MKGWLLFLIVVITVIFTIVLWNAYNNQSYQRLRKARAAWKGSSQEFRDKVKAGTKKDIGEIRNDIGSLWDQLGDLFDGDEEYDSDEGGYDGDYGGYM